MLSIRTFSLVLFSAMVFCVEIAAAIDSSANDGTNTAATDQPNVVIIYGDDIGYGDVGAYGAKLILTPNLDRLASESLMFTDGHCSASTCTPSRFSLLTGIHGFPRKTFTSSALPIRNFEANQN